MTYGLTDIHQHLLWGMDDGAATPQAMHHMLQDAHQQGIARAAATCHIAPGLRPFDLGVYRERLHQARDYCAQKGLDVEIIPGAEIAWTYQTVSALRQKKAPALGETDYVLLELWRDVSLQEARSAVRSLISAGYCPVLAHVERYRCFEWLPKQALRFRRETGALFQINADTLLQPGNMVEKRFVRILLEEHGLDAVASDAHGTKSRPQNLRKAHDWLRKHTDAAYARALTTFSGEL